MGRIPLFTRYICAVCLISLSILARGWSVEKYDKIFEKDEKYFLPSAKWLRAFSLGYTESAADLVWIKTLVYFGERRLGKSQTGDDASFTINYIRTAIELDPRFRNLYRRGGVLTLYQRGDITRKTIEMSAEVLEKGLEVFPDDGEIAFNLGFIYYYETDWRFPKGDKRVKNYKEKGALLLRKASLMDGAPKYSSLLTSTLLKREGLDDLMIDHLRAMLAKETDPEIRATIEMQLRQTLGQAAERDIALSRRYQDEWQASIPYIPYDLYLILTSGEEYSAEEMLNPLKLSENLLEINDNDFSNVSKGDSGS